MGDETRAKVAAHPTHDDIEASERTIERLQARKLPQMVNWWDASVLALVGVRTLISGTIGNYADQRPMQAAADNVLEDVLVRRHDYRGVCKGGLNSQKKPAFEGPIGTWNTITDGVTKSLKFDGDAIWVDFIADLGDGYEATYAMAYLMAKDALTIDVPRIKGPPVSETLPAGDILIMGGDLAYPNATIEEYNRRCIDPYDDAFRVPIPKTRPTPGGERVSRDGDEFDREPMESPPRKLFFIAGNHDWYDGLAAFTSVFCTARDRFAKGKGLTIGGWQTEQRRSYFALALPYGWWFWGVDLALNATIDEAQKSYFEAMSLSTEPGEKVIIIVHAPVWEKLKDSPLHDVSQWARRRGAEVVALLAGDLHFYSHFHSIVPEKPDTNAPALQQQLQLIVSGGGGAFLHPTHQIPHQREVHWSVPKQGAALPHDKSGDFRNTTAVITDEDFEKAKPFKFQSPHIYPSRGRSMLLSLKNLLLPFHNRKFALFVGLLYLVYAWVFQITTADPLNAALHLRAVQIAALVAECNFRPADEVDRCIADGKEALSRFDSKVLKERLDEVDKRFPASGPTAESRWSRLATASDKTARGIREVPPPTAEQLAKMEAGLTFYQKPFVRLARAHPEVFGENAATKRIVDFSLFNERGGWIAYEWGQIWPYISTERVIGAMLTNPAFFFMIIALYAGLMYYVGFEDGDFVPRGLLLPTKIVIGGVHAWLHIVLLLTINTFLQPIYDHFTSPGQTWPWLVSGVAIYSVLLILIGGVFGGMVFGLYWVLTSIIGKLHMDSFGALGIAGYKNFLRMKVEEDKVTVYAIGLDKVPGRKGWRALNASDLTDGNNPIIHPVQEMKPHVIEPPYEIRLTKAVAKSPSAPPPTLRDTAAAKAADADVKIAPAAAQPAAAAALVPDGLPAWRHIWS